MVLMGYFQALVPVIALALNVIVQVVSFRIIPKTGLLKSEYFGFFSGLFLLIPIEFWACFYSALHFKETVAIFIVNFLTYSALGYCYFHFVNLCETARRIRIVTELFYSKSGLLEQEILEAYNANEIIGRRISRLLGHGQVIEENGRYRIGNPLFLLMAKGVEIMKLVIFG
jgi:hypothetical protein